MQHRGHSIRFSIMLLVMAAVHHRVISSTGTHVLVAALVHVLVHGFGLVLGILGSVVVLLLLVIVVLVVCPIVVLLGQY